MHWAAISSVDLFVARACTRCCEAHVLDSVFSPLTLVCSMAWVAAADTSTAHSERLLLSRLTGFFTGVSSLCRLPTRTTCPSLCTRATKASRSWPSCAQCCPSCFGGTTRLRRRTASTERWRSAASTPRTHPLRPSRRCSRCCTTRRAPCCWTSCCCSRRSSSSAAGRRAAATAPPRCCSGAQFCSSSSSASPTLASCSERPTLGRELGACKFSGVSRTEVSWLAA
mmetsp:Transcript_19541/g.64618  ORF Transcript_19541/g.64618 Transcript_19541/m.64618 type:complete len:226 (-) Transcript_19541:164-841(-)